MSLWIVDVGSGQLLDMVRGRTAKAPTRWLLRSPRSWLAEVRWAVLGLSGPYRSAFDAALPEAVQVADPFHVVRLGNDALDEVRRRVQNQTLGHRGHKHDPLYRARKLLVSASENITDAGRVRLRGLLDAGDPYGEVRDAWHAKETLRSVYDIAVTPARTPSSVSPRTSKTPQCPLRSTGWAAPCGAGRRRSRTGTRPESPTPRPRPPFSGACRRVSSMSLTGMWRAVVDAFSGSCRWSPRCCWRREVDSASFGLPPPVEMRWRWPVRVQRVVMPVTGAESWTVVDDEWALVEPVERYLAHLAGIERSPNTVRAYAHGLRLWFGFLGVRRLACDSVGVEDVWGRLAVRGMAAGSGRQRDRVR